MAGMAEGTGLGEQFAIGMASAMDNFGVGAEASAKMVEDTMNIAGEMGVNGAAASQALQKNLKLAQKYNFKGGVKALGKMSSDALRLKLDMDGIASLADKVFRPEGAIEMAAQLSVMGGEFAKLGDPMTLMFKARNDMEGFAKDIGKATSEFVEFNKETGSFEVMGGLARDRMREISKMTGISVEKLQEMAVQQKKIESIGSITPINFEEKDKEFISSVSKLKDGEFYINIDGKDQLVKDLEASQLDSIRNQKETLEERAEAARTFEEVITDLTMTLKQVLVPVAKGLKEFLGKPLQDLQASWQKEGFYSTLRDFAGGAAKLVSGVLGIGVSIAKTLGPGGTLAALVGGSILFKAASWIAAGRMLRMGFNMGSGGFGRGGGGGTGGPGGGLTGGRSTFGRRTNIRGMNAFNMSRRAGMGSNFRAGLGSRAGIGAGILSGLVVGGMEFAENSEMGMDVGENLGRSSVKALSGGLGAWGGAAAGAAIGSAVPVIGTIIGGLIGGALGAMGGSAIGEAGSDAIFGDEIKSIGRKGPQAKIPVNDAIIEFNPRDKFMRVNDMLLASTSEGALPKAAKELNGGSSEVTHKFGDISGTIRFEGNGTENLNNPETQEKLVSMIAQRLAGNRNENKLTPNPQFG
jgi:uncharacterized protein (DUF697 family)